MVTSGMLIFELDLQRLLMVRERSSCPFNDSGRTSG